MPETKKRKKKTSSQPKIVIDEREGAIIGKEIAAIGGEVEWETLSVGDFVLSERLVAERKTRNDFQASIIDGRLFEQAERLGKAYDKAVIIVEGEKCEQRIGRKALLGAYASLVADYGLAVFFTRGMKATAELLYSLAHHEQCAKKVPLRVRQKPKSESFYDAQRAIVESLPGIGPKTAKALLRHFGTPQNIMLADEEKLKGVAGLGKKRAVMIRNVLARAWEEGC